MGLKRFKDGIASKLKRWFYHETWALPVDIFRVLAGILCIPYFILLLSQVEDFSSPDGLIDHDFYLENFWWLNINLIQPGLGDSAFYALLGFALVGSFGIIVGYRVKLLSAILFLITTCVQRWNFAVMFVDDGIMHLMLFWLPLLPVGRTLVLGEWLREGNGCFSRWLDTKVPGFPVSCFIGNLCWAYFFAGMAKAFSPMWQDGIALYAVLLIPISYVADSLKPEHLPFLKLANYAAVVTEITLPFFLLSPKGSIRKWIGLALQLSFHAGILLTLKIPFANIAFIASAVLFFREELMDAVVRRYKQRAVHVGSPAEGVGRLGEGKLISILALVFVVLVCASTLRRVTALERVGGITTSALWVIGVAQDYRLFDWIYRMNYHIDQEATFQRSGSPTPEKVDPTIVIPRTVRYSLVGTRVYDIYWLFHIPWGLKNELKNETRRRIERRACREIGESGTFVVKTTLHRVTNYNLEFKLRPRTDLMVFKCFEGRLEE